MKKIILSALLVFIANCLFAQGKISSITIEKTPCFGKCPWYYITIESNGNVTYTGKKDAVFDGVMPGKISKAEVTKLFSKYQSKPYWKLPSSYKSLVSDISKTHILIKSGTKTKTVKNAGDGPAWLKSLIQDIDNLERDKKINWDKKRFLPNTKSVDDESLLLEPASNTPQVEVEKMPEVVAPQDEKLVYSMVEQMPEYPGGQDALLGFIGKNLRYPSAAVEMGIQGKVIVSFVVATDGSVTDPTIVRGVSKECDQEALRVVKLMPRWKPGKQNGMSVPVKMNLPISFKLD